MPTATTPVAGASANTFTMVQIASHNSAASCWSVVGGSVYDLSSFVSKHPGGSSAIKSMCGVDGTAAFSGQHGSSGKPASTLAQYKIGALAN
jgi:cytochrome b involved in lipid metabolism